MNTTHVRAEQDQVKHHLSKLNIQKFMRLDGMQLRILRS